MLSSTDALEGFSLKEMFKQVFKHHGVDVVEEYIMVGTSKTTPPLEQVETEVDIPRTDRGINQIHDAATTP